MKQRDIITEWNLSKTKLPKDYAEPQSSLTESDINKAIYDAMVQVFTYADADGPPPIVAIEARKMVGLCKLALFGLEKLKEETKK